MKISVFDVAFEDKDRVVESEHDMLSLVLVAVFGGDEGLQNRDGLMAIGLCKNTYFFTKTFKHLIFHYWIPKLFNYWQWSPSYGLVQSSRGP